MKDEPGAPDLQAGPQSIVIVDDTPDNLRLLVGILKEQGYKVRPAPSGVRALATVRKEPSDLILLDIMMPDMDGYEVCRQLKADERTRHIPVVFLSALNEVFDKVKAFRAGGVDYIAKPFQVEEVLARVSTHLTIRAQQQALARQNDELLQKNALIMEQAEKLEFMATRDPLTGLSNRRAFQNWIEQEEKRFSRSARPFAFIMLDIDFFKKVNDTYGHQCGDVVLKGVARNLEQALRAQDIVARWGGEEFVCLLPETRMEGARNVAEKIRLSVEAMDHRCDRGSVAVTVTLGISVFDGSRSSEECLRLADDALYQGKRQGRNRAVAATPPC